MLYAKLAIFDIWVNSLLWVEKNTVFSEKFFLSHILPQKKPDNSDDNTDHFDKYHFYDGGKNDVTHDEHDLHCFQLTSKIHELSPD